MTDHQLLHLLQDQHSNSMDFLIKKYYRYVYTVVANIIGRYGTHEDIEELVEDTFYDVWTHAETIQGHLKAYLSTTARNKSKSWMQHRHELPRALDTVEIPDSVASLDTEIQRKELNQALMHAINRLNSKDREIFLRFYFYMQTTSEISKHMNLSANAVRIRLSRGRTVLQKSLSKEGWL